VGKSLIWYKTLGDETFASHMCKSPETFLELEAMNKKSEMLWDTVGIKVRDLAVKAE
jgi:hypothetical protein